MNRKVDNKIKLEKPQLWLTAGWWALVTLALSFMVISDDFIKFEDHTRLHLETKVRDQLGQHPQVDKRLKIIGIYLAYSRMGC